MGQTWQYTGLITGIVEALLAQDAGLAIAEFLDQVGESEMLAHMDKDTLVQAIGEEYEPDDIFTLEDLDEWAQERGYRQDVDDPPGYEERVRY